MKKTIKILEEIAEHYERHIANEYIRKGWTYFTTDEYKTVDEKAKHLRKAIKRLKSVKKAKIKSDSSIQLTHEMQIFVNAFEPEEKPVVKESLTTETKPNKLPDFKFTPPPPKPDDLIEKLERLKSGLPSEGYRHIISEAIERLKETLKETEPKTIDELLEFVSKEGYRLEHGCYSVDPPIKYVDIKKGTRTNYKFNYKESKVKEAYLYFLHDIEFRKNHPHLDH